MEAEGSPFASVLKVLTRLCTRLDFDLAGLEARLSALIKRLGGAFLSRLMKRLGGALVSTLMPQSVEAILSTLITRLGGIFVK
jgi:hypothetical protein